MALNGVSPLCGEDGVPQLDGADDVVWDANGHPVSVQELVAGAAEGTWLRRSSIHSIGMPTSLALRGMT